MELSYDGGRYFGWQRQKDNVLTIQGQVESALRKLFKDDSIAICASGRTDAGVHAYAQVAHAWVPDKAEKMPLLRGLNSLIPDDISVHSVDLVSDDFHAIGSSVQKTYLYKVYNSPTPFALNSKYKLWVRQPLDIKKLNDWSQVLVGTHDFKSFMTTGSEVKSTVREILLAEWSYLPETPTDIQFLISGTGFLKQMVRNIVGTLLHLHYNGGSASELKDILQALDRRRAFKSAPAHGLYLKEVVYPDELAKSFKAL